MSRSAQTLSPAIVQRVDNAYQLAKIGHKTHCRVSLKGLPLPGASTTPLATRLNRVSTALAQRFQHKVTLISANLQLLELDWSQTISPPLTPK